MDTPNRDSTLIRRFCHSNDLRVLHDNEGDYDDSALCLAFARLGISWMAIAVDDEGYACSAAASLASLNEVDAPAPKRISRREDAHGVDGMPIADIPQDPKLRYVVLEFLNSDKIERFFREC